MPVTLRMNFATAMTADLEWAVRQVGQTVGELLSTTPSSEAP